MEIREKRIQTKINISSEKMKINSQIYALYVKMSSKIL